MTNPNEIVACTECGGQTVAARPVCNLCQADEGLMPSRPTVTIPKSVLRRAAQALRYEARTRAGMSQAPDLFAAQDTQEWDDAQLIAKALSAAGATDIEVEE